jgi:rhodanese-related sulfurtransferase
VFGAPGVPTVEAKAVDPGALMLDVREQVEWDDAHVAGSLHIPMSQLVNRVAEVPADQRVVVICHSGHRSAQVTAWLEQQGYDAVNLEGGIVSWAQAGLPLE